MCLKVASRKLKAETDILVFKCLDYQNGKYCTPFQYVPIDFNKGIEVIEGGNKSLTIEKEWDFIIKKNIRVINHGVHAYTTKAEALDTARHFHKTSGTEMHYAVIPKGTAYYVGLNFEVVAEKMIVFRSKRNYDKYAEGKEIKEI